MIKNGFCLSSDCSLTHRSSHRDQSGAGAWLRRVTTAGGGGGLRDRREEDMKGGGEKKKGKGSSKVQLR